MDLQLPKLGGVDAILKIRAHVPASIRDGDPALGANAYAAGEALFDNIDPTRLVHQTEHPALKPMMPYEKTGQYAAGTTFAEGLVYFHNQWFLYYGCADSLVAVVTAPNR